IRDRTVTGVQTCALPIFVAELGSHPLRGLKNEIRKRQPDFSEKRYGYGGFLQFCKAAEAKGYVEMELDTENETYVVRPAQQEPKIGRASCRARVTTTEGR